MINILNLDTPIGKMFLCESEGFITELNFGSRESENPNRVLLNAKTQLEEYFRGERKAFSFPINPQGTDFQRSVWKALCNIPYGETASYQDIARSIGNEKAVRAVGSANNRNPILIIVPCHRVIGKDGSLTGYAGGIDKKEFLLNFESQRR